MVTHRRTARQLAGDQEAERIALACGAELRASRRRRRLTQAQLAERVGCGHAWVGRLEQGRGADAPVRTWIRLGIALGRPVAISFSRDLAEAPVDAGHLSAQEIVLRLARARGASGLFELATRPSDPARSADVGIRDDRQRTLILVEIWNRVDDVRRAARASDRKAAEAADLAAFRDPAYRVAQCWLFVDNAANRGLVRRYPEVIRARCPGSSVRWVAALVDGAPAPDASGVCWIDTRSGRISPMRLRAT